VGLHEFREVDVRRRRDRRSATACSASSTGIGISRSATSISWRCRASPFVSDTAAATQSREQTSGENTSDATPLVTGRNAVQTLKVTLSIAEAARTGQIISTR
jgi:hypothetical protein